MARILVVEDDALLANMVRAGLSTGGDEVVVCRDGHAAVELAATSSPDLVLLDVNMPHLDGFEVCRRIRDLEPPDQRATLVMVTSRDELSSKLLAFSAGVDDYVLKPIDVGDLRSRVTRWMESRAQRADLLVRRRREAIQEVVTAVCHQVNNPLAVALMGLDLVLQRGGLPSESAGELETVRAHLLRISRVLRQMRVANDESVPYIGERKMIHVKPLE